MENGIEHERVNVGESEHVKIEDEDDEGRNYTMISTKDAGGEDEFQGFGCDDEKLMPDEMKMRKERETWLIVEN